MPYTTIGRLRMLTGLIQGQVFVSAHTADPGDSGANEVSGSGYARKPITWNPVVNGKVISSSKPSLRIPSGMTVTHIGFWNALTGGAMRAYFDVADVAFQVEQGYVISGVTFEVGGGPVVSPPGAPANVQATTVSPSSIQVTWSASVGATDYTVQRTVDPTGDETWVSITTTTSTSYTDTGLTPLTEYFYRIVAFNLAGPSFPSASDSAITDDTTSPEVPTAPTNFTATAQTSTTIRTAWTPSTSGAESYKVQRLTTVPNPTDTTPPSIPSLSASAVSQSQINLSWSQSTDPSPNPSGVAGYRLYRNTGTTGGGALLTTRSGATNTTFSDVGLSALTAYTYEVQSFDVAGNASSRSPSVTVTTLAGPVEPQPPATPTGLAGSAQSSTLVRLNWNAVTGATGYRLFRSTTQIGGNLTATTFDDTGRTASTTYSYSVEAFNTAGTSARSSAISVTTPSTPPPGGSTVWIAAAGDLMNAGTTPGNAAATQRLNVANLIKSWVQAGTAQRVMLMGDLIYNFTTTNQATQYDNNNPVTGAFNQTYGTIRSLLQPCPGNHENSLSSYYNYFAYLATAPGTISTSGTPGQYQAVDLGNGWVIISINFYLAQSSLQAGGAHYNWMNQVLQNNTSKRFIIEFHPPKYANCIDKLSEQGSINAMVNDMWNLGIQAGVDLALTGHSHSYFRNNRISAANAQSTTGIYHICNGMGGDNKDPSPGGCAGQGSTPSTWPGVFRFDQHFGATHIQLNGANVSGTQVSAQDGSVRDIFSFVSRK